MRGDELPLLAYFDYVRDQFLAGEVAPGVALDRLKKVTVVVDPDVHDTPRHYAATRDDGRLVRLAPQLLDLPSVQSVAVIAHELGHAADFLYPGHFLLTSVGGPAKWKVPEGRRSSRQLENWYKRTPHEVETTADAISLLVTGAVIRYAGECRTKSDCLLIQTFGPGGEDRPEWLR